MPKPLILVVDSGAFLPFAQALSKEAEVLYFSEFREVAPKSRNALVGRDIPGIQRVDSIWEYIDDVDCIAFPDVGDGDLQHWLRSKNYRVFGSGKADGLELDRFEFKKLLQSLGLPVIEGKYIVGLEDLKRELRDRDDLYVKTSFFRGDLETFHHINWSLSEGWFRELQHRLGPHGQEIELVVEPPVKAVEIGYDGYCIDGEFPLTAAFGLECKDQGYIGRICKQSEMPACIQETNEALSSALNALGLRGCYSTEIRMAEDGTAFLNDPTVRCPAPPSGCMSIAITNWVDIVLAGAEGTVVEPEYDKEYACEIELVSPWLEHEFLAIEMPAEIEQFVRFRRACVYDDRYWCVPSEYLDIAGSAVGLGNTPEQAIDKAVEVAEQIQALQLTYNKNIKQELLDGWSEALDAAEHATTRNAEAA